MFGPTVTLTGRFGIALTGHFWASTKVVYRKGERVDYGVNVDGIRMDFGVGTTGDPNLTDAEWILRDQEESAHRFV